MRLGANGFPYETPEQWLQRVKELNTSTVTAPISCQDPPELKRTYRQLIQTHRLSVGEVGIWRNSLSPDPQERKAALEFSKGQLMLAEELGAGCCVNIAGARGQIWSGYYPENYSADAYALLVDTVREIVDSVKPSRTFYTIEPMQWMHPDSPDDYLKLLQDIDRDSVGVHLDYVNMINGIERYRQRSEFIKECYRKLGPHIKSIHAKDLHLGPGAPCCLQECDPGKGEIDFALVLRLAHRLGPDIPVFVEHMTEYSQFQRAMAYLRQVGERHGIPIQ